MVGELGLQPRQLLVCRLLLLGLPEREHEEAAGADLVGPALADCSRLPRHAQRVGLAALLEVGLAQEDAQRKRERGPDALVELSLPVEERGARPCALVLEEQLRERMGDGFDEERTPRHLPYIVVVIDEMADLMMVSKKEAEMAITRLKGLDPIAYIRFASVYHQFVSLDEMLEELNRMANAGPFALAPEQARLFEDDMDSLIRGEVPPVREEAVATTEDVDREPVSLDARRAR